MATMADESKYPTRIAPYGLRMPDDLKQRIQSAAEAANRSMNAEIIARLQATFEAKSSDLQSRIAAFPLEGLGASPVLDKQLSDKVSLLSKQIAEFAEIMTKMAKDHN